MGFGSFLKKISNPIKHAKFALDPAGSAIRSASGNNTITGRSMLDPSGKLLVKEQPGAAPVQRQPYVSRLSPGAQALKDRMLARRQQPVAPPPQQAPVPQGRYGGMIQRAMGNAMQQAPQPQPQQQMVGMADPRQRFYADGGHVKKSNKAAANSTSKVFDRKPNGKPF